MHTTLSRLFAALAIPLALAAPGAVAERGSVTQRWSVDDYPAGIALFSERDFYGTVREVFDPFESLHDISFNDEARSVAVLSGQWELCEHRDFTGLCVFVREDVDDLGWFGLSRRISSVRPVLDYTEAAHGLLFTRDRYGYIRYAHGERWGDDDWRYGYRRGWRPDIYHFGFSRNYRRYGYYDPAWGYDPYGFAWGPRGHRRYWHRHYIYHPRPVYINPYWNDWCHDDWSRDRYRWRDTYRHKDYWRGQPGQWPREDQRKHPPAVSGPVPNDPGLGRPGLTEEEVLAIWRGEPVDRDRHRREAPGNVTSGVPVDTAIVPPRDFPRGERNMTGIRGADPRTLDQPDYHDLAGAPPSAGGFDQPPWVQAPEIDIPRFDPPRYEPPPSPAPSPPDIRRPDTDDSPGWQRGGGREGASQE